MLGKYCYGQVTWATTPGAPGYEPLAKCDDPPCHNVISHPYVQYINICVYINIYVYIYIYIYA